MDARNYLMDGLFEMYPEADKACKNPAHFFYGTNKQGQVLNPKALPMGHFFSVLESDKVKNGGRLRKIASQSRGAAFLRKDGFSWASYSNTIGAPSKATNEQKTEYYEDLKRNKYNRRVETAYFPQRLKNFSPYPSDHAYRNLITAERDLLDGIEQTEPITRMPLENAEQLLEYKFTQAMDCLSDDIFIFKLPTGIGKTRRVKDLNEVTLAFPTNNLKQEVFAERETPDSAIMTPEFPVFTSDDLNESIDRLFKAGFVKQVHRLLWDIKKGGGCSLKDQKLARAYTDKNQAVQHSVDSIFTTHSRAIHTPFSHDTIIFDEDPLPLLLDVNTLKIADLKKIKKNSTSRLFGRYTTRLITLQRYLEGIEEGEIITLPDEFKIDISSEWLLVMQTEGIDSNIIKFLDCTYFYKDETDRDLIHFINQEPLPEDKKVIIMSATIPVEIYKELYGERVQVIDISDVAHKGTITQHTKYSYSRNSLANHLEQANAKLPMRPTITFKSFNDQVNHSAPDMWFGNCSGYNQYTGTSINVLGTPHKHNAQYLLIGKVLGVNVDQFNREFRMQTVE